MEPPSSVDEDNTNEGLNKVGRVRTEKKAGITFPVKRIHRLLKRGNYAPRISKDASVYLIKCRLAVSKCQLPLPPPSPAEAVEWFGTGTGPGLISVALSSTSAGVLEYLSSEVLELSGNAARENKRRVIKPRYVMLAIRSDEELNALFGNVVIPESGVLPFVHPIVRMASARFAFSKEGRAAIAGNLNAADDDPRNQ